MIATSKEAELVCGPLSRTEKMPCASYNLPADMCRIGSRLRNVEGSVCSRCYARRNRYTYPNVKTALWRHYASLDNPMWAEAMAFLINKEVEPYFRFHDSGDIADADHLNMIVDVVERCPKVKFWIPTLEFKLVYDKFGPGNRNMPGNMVARLSTAMVGVEPYKHVMEFARRPGVVMSMVSLSPSWGVVKCPATWGDDPKCGACRACWDRSISIVCYKPH